MCDCINDCILLNNIDELPSNQTLDLHNFLKSIGLENEEINNIFENIVSKYGREFQIVCISSIDVDSKMSYDDDGNYINISIGYKKKITFKSHRPYLF